MADLDASVMGRDSGECATRHDATFTEYAQLAKCGTRIELAKGVETEESVAEIARSSSSGNGGATKKRRRNGNKGNAHQKHNNERGQDHRRTLQKQRLEDDTGDRPRGNP
jgi:hypothetical protein